MIMLRHTFSHVPGIGLKTESKIWQAGIHDWQQFLQHPAPPVPRVMQKRICEHLERSGQALEENDPAFFAATLPPARQWRLFSAFRSRTCYLDIETTADAGEITVISVYDGEQIFSYVNGDNLADFERDIHLYQTVVTFNGKHFDVPVIERFFKMRMPHIHLDLRHILRAVGVRGGLKSCEKQMGIGRGALDGVDGLAAIWLWREYERYGDRQALETLLAYNVLDVLNLEPLLVAGCNLLTAGLPFADQIRLPEPLLPANPYQPDPVVLTRLRQFFLHSCLNRQWDASSV